MVNHDADYDGIVLKEATSADCRALVLANGENMPELSDFLEIMASSASPTKLIIEIKDHGSAALNQRAATAAVELVKQYDVASKVEYISFSADACEQIVAEEPGAKVAYLSGGVPPNALHDKGYTGIDYHIDEFRSHPEWVAEAHQAGMTANVWTVNDAKDIAVMVNLNVDYITTDIPLEASALISEMR